MEIIVHTIINASIEKVWEYYTDPKHITQWNFAHESWECTSATNVVEVGGEFHYKIGARDKSVSFDFWGTYTEIIRHQKIYSYLGDGRKLEVIFNKIDENSTEIFQRFEPEESNPVDLQEQGWQSILNQFKKYTEGN